MIVFEDWIEKPFSRANRKEESAINLAELYWQGLDPDLNFSLRKRFDLLKKLSSFKKFALNKLISIGCNINYRI